MPLLVHASLGHQPLRGVCVGVCCEGCEPPSRVNSPYLDTTDTLARAGLVDRRLDRHEVVSGGWT